MAEKAVVPKDGKPDQIPTNPMLIATVQYELGRLVKDEMNPHFKNRYYTLDSLLEALKPLLKKHGLQVLQTVESSAGNGRRLLKTEVYGGMGITSSSIELPNTDDMQKLGSAITYAQRYSLKTLFLVEGDEDDDGNASVPAPLVSSNRVPVEGKCPDCGSKLVSKAGKSQKTGKPYQFTGCSNFPNCRYIVREKREENQGDYGDHPTGIEGDDRAFERREEIGNIPF